MNKVHYKKLVTQPASQFQNILKQPYTSDVVDRTQASIAGGMSQRGCYW
jgi:hypothetical protein